VGKGKAPLPSRNISEKTLPICAKGKEGTWPQDQKKKKKEGAVSLSTPTTGGYSHLPGGGVLGQKTKEKKKDSLDGGKEKRKKGTDAVRRGEKRGVGGGGVEGEGKVSNVP